MNKLPVYLYSKLLEVILDLDQNERIYKIMYQRKIKIQKGFKDTVQIQFKNSDQKPVEIGTGTYFFDMIDSAGRELVFSKQLVSQEYTSTNTVTNTVSIVNKGIANVTFEATETINLVAGDYKLLIKRQNNDSPVSYTPAYSNTYYDITGEIEIAQDGFPIGYPIQTIDMEQLEASKEYDRDPSNMGYFFTSEWLRPVERPTTGATTSTAKITLASFKGTIEVQATLDNTPSPAGHANAQTFNPTNTPLTTYTTSSVTHGTIDLSWTGEFTAVRFKIRPAPSTLGSNYFPTGYPVGSKTNKFPSGFIDQIQYIS
jgi:hypothetical protein